MPRNSEIKTEDGQCSFLPIAAPQTTSSLEANLQAILGVWQRSLHALSILKKHMTEFLRINFKRFCRSMALVVSCYVPLSHSTANQRFVFG